MSLESTVADLKRMEVTVLTALDWRVLTVTAVSVLDPLVGLLQWQHPALHGVGFELALLASEGSKVLIAKALRGVLCCHTETRLVCCLAVAPS